MRNPPAHQVLSQENMIRFLSVYAATGNFTLAAQAIGTTAETVTRWKNRSERDAKDPRYLISDPLGEDPDVSFFNALRAAKDESLTPVRDKAMDMAVGRHAEPVVYQGRIQYVEDTTKDPRVDPISGLTYYPPKTDPLTGEPIPLLICKVVPRMTELILTARDPDFRPKADLDITTQGKPIAVPERVVDMATFLAEFGRKVGG